MLHSSEVLVLVLVLTFFVPLIFAWMVNKHPDIIAKGQDAAGRGMAVGCFSIMLMAGSVILALAAAITVGVQHKHMALAWRIVGLLPLIGSVITAFVIYFNVQLAKDRREQRNHEEAMSIPAALIVDNDDARVSRLYNAVKPSFPTLEISMRHPGALYWQQREWFPRLRLLMMNADAMMESQGQNGELTQDLLNAMCRAKPVCPIVLHAQTPVAAETVKARLDKAGWVIQTELAEGDDWIDSRWRDVAVGTLSAEMAKRPAKLPQDQESAS